MGHRKVIRFWGAVGVVVVRSAAAAARDGGCVSWYAVVWWAGEVALDLSASVIR